MTKTVNKGICLSFSEESIKKSPDRLLQGVVSLVSFAALMLIFTETTGFGGRWEIITMLITGLYLNVMFTLLSGSEGKRWFYSGTLLVILLAAIIAGDQLTEGFRLFRNTLADKWTVGNGEKLKELKLLMGEESHGTCRILFAAVISAVIALISCVLTSVGSWAVAAIIALALFSGPVLFKTEITPICLMSALSASVFVFLSSGWKNRRKTRPTLVTAVICAVIIFGLLAVCLQPAVSAWGEEKGRETQERIHKNRFETGYTTLPEGDFTDFKPYTGDAVPALVVTMDTPEKIYLRGFAGCTFENGRWMSIENEMLASNSELLYWLNEQEFNPAAQFEAAAASLGFGKSTVTVQNLGACSAYVYVPYSVTAGSMGDYLSSGRLNTDSVSADGDRTYIYSVLSGGTGIISETLDELRSSEQDDVLSYRVAESAYRKYVYNTYLHVSPDMQQTMEDLFEKVGLDYENADSLTPEQAQEKVLTFLGLCFGEEAQELELPLETLKGTSYQYSTIAALALRCFGIASRYAEGYVITDSMAQNAGSGESINVDSTCAKSWVEVYQDGIGWIPMDMTPGLGEMTREENTDTTTNSSSPKIEEGEELEEEPQENDPEPDPLGGTLVTIGKAIKWTAIIILLLIILAVLFIVIRRKILRGKRERLYSSINVNNAVAWLFSDTALLLRKTGFDNGNGSMTSLSEDITEFFGSEYGERYDEMVALNGWALFSVKPMEEEHRTIARDFFGDTVSNLKTKVKRYKWLWMKWIRCLY